MAVTLSSDFIYVIAMLKTTPLVVTIGLSLTIPLAVVGDFFLGRSATLLGLFGALLVLLAFAAVGLEDSKKQELPEPIVRVGDIEGSAEDGDGIAGISLRQDRRSSYEDESERGDGRGRSRTRLLEDDEHVASSRREPAG